MASSTSVFIRINSALDRLDSRMSYSFGKNGLIFLERICWLRNIKTFVLLAGKFGNDVHRRYYDNLLIRIEDLASRYEHRWFFHSRSLKKEMGEWYIAMSDEARQSNYLTANDVGDISESILENLVWLCRLVSAEAMKLLGEHMNFLKNFCRFATSRGVGHGQMKDFLAHTEAVVISAAHLCFLCSADILDEEGIQLKVSKLLEKIKPTDSQVCKIYTEALTCSKLSRRLDAFTHIQEMEDDSTIAMKNFVDSLVSFLWEMLPLDTCHVASFKDHRQVLYEGLRSLKIILKKLQPKDIDEKTWDELEVMVCDAGVSVCSFYHKNVEIDLALQDLLERIKVFLAEAKEEVPQTSTYNPSSIHVRGFVDFLLENLTELTNDTVEPIVRSRVQSIKVELLYLKSLLEEIVELRYEQAELRALRNRVLEVSYRVEFLIDYLIVGDISDLFSMQFDSVMEDIQNIETDAWKSSSGKGRDIKIKEVGSTSSHALPPQKIASLTADVVGFHDEARSIMGRLQRGSKELRVIAIVSMGGLGKTTLATKVYNDPKVIQYFHVRASCTVSQTLDKRKLLLELLIQIHDETRSDPKIYKYYDEDDLAENLRKYLKGKRYLIFLDDVWTIEAWNSLRASFPPDDDTGSRIILTSRNHDVAVLDQEPLYLREFSEGESLELLQSKLFSGEVWPPALYDLGVQIVEICKGLPLTIVLVAGLLATTEQEGWKEIVDSFSSGISSVTEQCMNSMELSYKHLPDYLKLCFLYFGAFPEDRDVSVRRLIRLWIAEGFIQKSALKSLKDTAEDYLMDLIGRSLIMVAKRGSMGGLKTCRIHDLLREFCLRKATGEHFLHLVKGYDELLAFNEPCNLRRLCIHSEAKHLEESKLFCPRVRSLLFFSQKEYAYDEIVSINIFLFHIFKFVRVLDLVGIHLGYEFPIEIELLVQLRYLAIRGNISVIPSWVGNLSMLEAFIVDPCGVELVSLPDTIWNLRKLKYLSIRSYFHGGGLLAVENLDNSSVLIELDTFCGAVFTCGDSMVKQMRKFPNIRRLKCILLRRGTKEYHNIGVPDFLSGLESLTMTNKTGPTDTIVLPTNLKKLTLRGFGLPWNKISTIGKLPNLEVLKLLDDSFSGETWEMEEGEVFPKLRYLKLSHLDLVRWTDSDSDDQFPRLEKLVLDECWELEEIPSYLESMPTLEMIEVFGCRKLQSVKRIEEEQLNLGNSAFQIRIDAYSYGDIDFDKF